MGTSATPEPDSDKPPLALIAGPTASGKSELAVRLALALRNRGRDGVVINADSAQVYTDLRVLSARPSPEEMRGVEHRLFGAWDGAAACSAADWAIAARAEIGRVLIVSQEPPVDIVEHEIFTIQPSWEYISHNLWKCTPDNTGHCAANRLASGHSIQPEGDRHARLLRS